jgi:tetratricopeptide (TPR) repeat protein
MNRKIQNGVGLAALCLGWFCATTRAQSTLPKAVNDSLWAVWNNPHAADTSRLNAMLDIALGGYVNSQPDSAFYYAQLMYDLAERKGLKKPMASALNCQGRALVARGDLINALDRFTRSLKIQEELGNKAGIATSLNNIGNIYSAQGDHAQAIDYHTRSLTINEELDNKAGIARSLINIGVIYKQQGDHAQAIDYFTRSLKIKEVLGDKDGVANALNNIGVIHQNQGDHAQAIDYHTRSRKIQEELGDKAGIARSLNNIGAIYTELGDHANAIDYFTRSLKIEEELGNKDGIARSLNNVGNIHDAQGDHARALDYYTRSLKIQEVLGSKDGIAASLNNIGAIYKKQDDHAQAIDYYTRSLKIREELGDKEGIATSLGNLGLIHRDQGDHAKAVAYGTKGLHLAQEVGHTERTRDLADLLYDSYKALDRPADALKMYELYITMRDSIASEENQREVIRQEYKYDYEKQALADSLTHANELAQLESEKTIERLRADRNRNRAMGLGGGVILVLGGGVAFFRSDRKRRKARFEKDVAELETQALRSQMNPHFIFNALNSINAFVQKNQPEKASSFLTRFAKLMRAVLENSRQSDVPLDQDLEALATYLDLERTRSGDTFEYSIHVAEGIDQQKTLVPPLVIQPFIENAIWHGMAGRTEKGHITLSVSRKDDQLVMAIEDDGAGRPQGTSDEAAAKKKNSLGTTITRARLDLVQKQKGKPAGFRYIDLPQGTRVEVSLPMSLAA